MSSSSSDVCSVCLRSPQATGRMQKNLNYFKINYLLFCVAILSAFIMYHPMSLLAGPGTPRRALHNLFFCRGSISVPSSIID